MLGRYSNLSDQEERLHELLGVVPEGTQHVDPRTPKQVQRRLEPTEVDQLTRAYASGSTLRDLARDFRVHRTTAAEILERAGIDRRGKGPTDSDVRQAIKLYEEGQSTVVIGKRLGFSAETIGQRLRTAGVPIRRPHD